MREEESDFMRDEDSLREKILHTEPYIQYKRLSEYAMMRDSCTNSTGENKEVTIDSIVREKYIKAYEKISGMHLRADYPNYKKIIESNTEDVRFISTKPIFENKEYGHLNYILLFISNGVELDVSYQPYHGKSLEINESWFTMASVVTDIGQLVTQTTGFHMKHKESGRKTLYDFERTIKYIGIEHEPVDIDLQLMFQATFNIIRL